ncbi:MAG: hypothetical protein ORN54_08995 [Cyclobacteriaceae bacterium]|nr:hypothetical protein [Cyclobacteriaceae bacterium]
MYVPFQSLPDHARIWVYQASRKLSDVEAEKIRSSQHTFCEQWEAHGQALHSSFKLEYNQFLIVGVDEGVHSASGCSIDGSVRILKGYHSELGVNFLDPSQIPFILNGEVKLFPRLELKSLFESGQLNGATRTFNNLVATKADFEKQWEIPAEKSWLVKYLPKPSLIV